MALPYTPVLTAVPRDWLLALNFNPGDLIGINFIAIDQMGDVWITNGTTNTVSELNPAGVELSPAGGYTTGGTINDPFGIFIDASGTIWLTNYFLNTVEAINSSGNNVAGPFGSSATYTNPAGMTLDSFGRVWVANSGNGGRVPHDVTVTTTSGAFAFFVDTSTPGTYDLIADTTVSPNIIWISHKGLGGVARIIDDGTSTFTVATTSGGGQSFQYGLAIDTNGDCWVTNYDSVTKIHNAATPTVALGPVTGGGISSSSNPEGIAIDSSNNVWVLNYSRGTLTELDTNGNALSPATGFKAGGLIRSVSLGIAIDRSGDVWIAANFSMTELIGAAAPVATPLVHGRPHAP